MFGYWPWINASAFSSSVHLITSDGTLTFKGGTSLNKIHAGFYRLSEDLDFSISMPVDSARSDRSSCSSGPGFWRMLLLAVSPKLRFRHIHSRSAKTDVFIAGPVWGESRDCEPFWRFEPLELAPIEEVSPAFEIAGDNRTAAKLAIRGTKKERPARMS